MHRHNHSISFVDYLSNYLKLSYSLAYTEQTIFDNTVELSLCGTVLSELVSITLIGLKCFNKLLSTFVPSSFSSRSQ